MIIVHDHNISINVYEDDPKVGSKQACIVDAAVVYDKSKMSQDFILLINHAIEMKSLNHHLLCSK